MEIDMFRNDLMRRGCSNNTVRAYCFVIRDYYNHFNTLNENNLRSYFCSLNGQYSSSTINLRVSAMNSYLNSIQIPSLCIKHYVIKKTSYLENVITNDEYERLKNYLKTNSQKTVYFLVRYMGSTGMRISEVLDLKIEDIHLGYVDICSKGYKERRIFIPFTLAQETMAWLLTSKRHSGYLFLNKFGKHMSASGARYLLHYNATKCGIAKDHAHPHAFRHRFALNFLAAHQDISLLSDILGHSSIETTRIYLRQTRDEQKKMIDSVVTW